MLLKFVAVVNISFTVCFSHTKFFPDTTKRKLATEVLKICVLIKNHSTSTASFKNMFSFCRSGKYVGID